MKIFDTQDENFKADVKTYLNNPSYEILVEFTKSDGSSRIMYCTTAISLINQLIKPVEVNTDELKTKRHRKRNEDVQSVFDLDKREWRSFRWDRIAKIVALEK